MQKKCCLKFVADQKKSIWRKNCLDLPLCEGRGRGKKRLLAVIEEPPVRVVLSTNGISTGLLFGPLGKFARPIIIGDLLVWGTLLFTGRVRANGGDCGV